MKNLLVISAMLLVLSCSGSFAPEKHDARFSGETGNESSDLGLSGVGRTPPTPPKPRNMFDVATVNKDASDYTRPFIPPYRTSKDGRIGLNMKRFGNYLGFNLLKPEMLSKSPSLADSGVQMVGHSTSNYNTGKYRHDNNLFHQDTGGRIGHVTICDPRTNNPQPHSSVDRYQLFVVAGYLYSNSDSMRFWKTPITVDVQNPKTKDAQISNFIIGTPVSGPILSAKEFFEPMFVNDGKLLVGRVANSDLSEYGFNGRYDIAYSIAPNNANACDITKFTSIKPIANLPYDEEAKDRYKIATYPFKDSFGRSIGPTENLRGTYPWMDRNAANLFFFTDESTLHYSDQGTIKTRYPVRCVDDVNCNLSPNTVNDIEAGGKTRGLTMMGLWSHGKAVTLDGPINFTDFGTRSSRTDQREANLYQNTWVRLAAGRDNASGVASLPAAVVNSTFVDSVENLFNYHSYMKPVTPRDVVWNVSRGTVTSEIVFDDYLDPHMIIFSRMNAAWSQETGKVHNGFNLTASSRGFDHGLNNNWTIQLANSATSPIFASPESGRVIGPGRVEPVALGGVYGKGFWLTGNTLIRYNLKNSVEGQSWYLSFFLDNRSGSENKRRTLFKLPNGTQFLLNSRYRNIIIRNASKDLRIVKIPVGLGAWRHFGFRFNQNSRRLETFIDGMRLDQFVVSTSDKAKYMLTQGNLEFGARSSNGVRGWIDEIKVNLRPNRYSPEVLCNHARGTMLGLNARSNATGQWDKAIKWPNSWTNFVNNHLNSTFNRYVCFTRYNSEMGANLANIPGSAVSLRDQFVFPEVEELVQNQPRPDTTSNHFCLSCHVDSNAGTTSGVPRSSALQVSALESSSALLRVDTRRQPMMGPQVIYGNVPKGFIKGPDGVARPGGDRSFSTGGRTDYWVFPQ